MNEIIPSTKLKIVTVHKLWDMTCLRQYFWRHVLNLEPAKINLAFHYGGVLGAGFEALLLGKTLRQSLKAVDVESRKRCSRHRLTFDDSEEIKIQNSLIRLFIEATHRVPHPKFNTRKMHMTESQVKVKFRLKRSPIWFLGTLDGLGDYRKREVMFETKTARFVNNDYISVLSYDKQIHSYALGRRKMGQSSPASCCYCIFRKVQKKIKRGQTIEEFVDEIERDLSERADWYFIMHSQTLKRPVLRDTELDIERAAQRLSRIYKELPGDELLKFENWDKQDKQCLNYGACPYLVLCRNPRNWQLSAGLFQQRQMLYEEEERELKK